MNNETKRDVFDAVWNRLAGYQVFFNGWPRETLDGYKKRYDNALPDDLPVIPNYVAEYIDAEKNNNNVIQAGIDAIEYSKGSIELTTWIEKNGDTFSRAWLDGYEIDNKS